MTSTDAAGAKSLVGRADLLATVRDRLAAGDSVRLTGVAGIGKSTMLAAVAEREAAAGTHVLRCGPHRSDEGLPFLTLADLFESVPERAFERLPGALRRALDIALVRAEVPGEQP